MILAFLLALLACIALVPIVLPLLKGGAPVPTRASFDQAVYRDQLRELERDVARGVIAPEEAEASRLEIQRRLLAADRLPATPARLTRSPVVALFVFVLIGGGSIGSYLYLGAPGLPDVPFGSRPAETAAGPDLRQAAEQLAAKLRQDPSDTQSWLLYARSLSMLGAWDKAEDAYDHAMSLGQTGSEVLADRAEVRVMAAGGTVTPAADKDFRQVLAADPNNGMARYYLALAAAQAGEPRKAIDAWQALLAEMPANSPLRGQIGQRIAAAAQAAGIPVPELAQGTAPTAGPDANAVAAAESMPDEQREAMIRGMVANLAAKQAADPGNFDGWLRLGQAYAVLKQPDQAADAFAKAAALRPDDSSVPLAEVRALMTGRQPTDKMPARVIDLLHKVQAKDPNQPMVLWYLGIAAAQESRPAEARRYWEALAGQLPAGSEDRRMIQAALETLPAK